MPPATDLFAYAVAVFHLAWIPGPSWMTTLAAARRREAGAAALAIAGVAVANVLFIVGAGVLKYSGILLPVAVRTGIGLAGCVTLTILAGRIFFAKRPLRASAEKPSIEHPFVSSLMVHLTNPNSWVFYVSVFLATTRVGPHLATQVALLGAIAVLADLAFMSLIAIAMAHALAEVPATAVAYAGKVAGLCMAYLGTRNAFMLLGLA